MANFNLDVAYEYAVNAYKEKSAPIMARNSGAEYDEAESVFTLIYLGDKYRITYPDGRVTFTDKEGEVDLKVQVLLLHYLTEASGVPQLGHLISFKEVPGGDIYIEPFNKRAVFPFVGMFGEKPEAFKKIAEALGGTPEKKGDVSYTIPVLPRFPITFILWLADDEFPASGTILFDSSATRYLPTEDFAVISQLTVFKMRAMLEKI